MFDALPEDWNQLWEAFGDPQRLHAAMVHLPIAIAMLGFLLVLGVMITGGKSPGLRWTTVFVYLIGTLAALWTVKTGEDAEENLKAMGVMPAKDTEVYTILHNHEELAEYFWIGLAAVAALIILTAIRVTWWKTLTILLALIIGAANVVWVGVIGHYGGQMVYLHSVGVPSDAPKVTPPPSTEDEKDKEKDAAAKDAAAKDAEEKDKEKDGDKDKTDTPKDKDPGEREEINNPGDVKDQPKLFTP